MSDRQRCLRVAIDVSLAILIPVAALLLITGIADYTREQDLAEHGIEVPASVVHVDVDYSGESGPTSTLTVRFKPRGDQLAKTTAELSYDGDFNADHPDSRDTGTRVQYDPDDPEHARIVGETGDALDRMIAGAVFTLVLVPFVIVRFKRPDILGLTPRRPDRSVADEQMQGNSTL